MSSSDSWGEALHPHLVHEGTVTSIDISDDASVEKLRSGSIGLLLVLFLCVTGSAPLAVFMFNFPFVVGAGNEKYAPAAFLFATIVLTIFSVGYVQMARKLRAAGGMFTYVSHGLGRTLGMMSGLSLAAAYTLFGASLIGGFAAFAQAKVAVRASTWIRSTGSGSRSSASSAWRRWATSTFRSRPRSSASS